MIGTRVSRETAQASAAASMMTPTPITVR